MAEANLLLVLPIALPLASAVAQVALRHRPRAQAAAGGLAELALVLAALALARAVWAHGVLATHVGGWPMPFGIPLVADLLSAGMVLVAALMTLAVGRFAAADPDPARETCGRRALVHVMVMGVCGAFLTGDLFNLFVWFEVMLMASFALMALGGERAQLEGAIKYVTLNLLSSALFLGACGLLYGTLGTLNLADLAVQLGDGAPAPVIRALAMLFLVAFGIKAAMFPLFAWLPASYATPPIDVTAIFSALLTKVGVYALIRIFTLVFVGDPAVRTLLLWLAGATMVTGVLGAVAQTESRRLLSFHIVSQIGYLLMGLGLATASALAGAIFFMVHVILAKSALFLVAGAARRLTGSYELARSGGLYAARPWLSVLFLVPALSLAGLPPLSGFFAKLALVEAGLAAGHGAIVATALGVSLLTLFSMMKLWAEIFWKPAPEPLAAPPPGFAGQLAPIAALALAIVLLGLCAGPGFEYVTRAAAQLSDPSAYVHAVMEDLG